MNDRQGWLSFSVHIIEEEVFVSNPQAQVYLIPKQGVRCLQTIQKGEVTH